MLNEFKNTGRGRSSVKPLCQPPGVIARKDIVQAKATQRFQAQLEPQSHLSGAAVFVSQAKPAPQPGTSVFHGEASPLAKEGEKAPQWGVHKANHAAMGFVCVKWCHKRSDTRW